MWHTKKLNEVCDIQSGLWKGKKGPYTTALVLRNTNFTASGVFDYSNVVELEVEAKQLAKREVIKNDIILEKSGGGDKTPVGRVCIHDKESKIPFSLSNFTARIRVLDSKELNAKFLHKFLYFLYISGKTEPMQRHSTGIRNLQLTQYKDIDVPLPPLAEQQRIVAKLDAAFAEIDEAVEAVKKNIQNSKRYYSYAIDNEFSKYSDKTKSIGEHSKINYGHTAKASFEKGRYKFLRITDIQGNAVDWNSVPYCEVETKKLPSVLLNDGDIVFARTGATTGKSFLVENPVDSVFASYLIRVSIDKKVFLPKYVMHYFQSAAYWQQVNEGISGAAQGGFNATKLRELRIPIINKTEQLEVVQKLDLINEQSASLQNTYALKKHALNSLKSAILSSELKLSEAA